MHVFEQAQGIDKEINSVTPDEIYIPSIKGKYLKCLKLGRTALNKTELQKTIKDAYRLQAKKHHPDLGGDSTEFMKIHTAYEELISWAEKPSFIRRFGLPDKWFYDGASNRWLQPTLAD